MSNFRPGVRLAYHEVGAEEDTYLYSITVSKLSAHLNVLRDQGVRSRLAEPVVTFDDGWLSQYRHALPVLAEYGEEATFFVTAGWTGARSDCMTAAQLRELAALGHRVQSHGWTHALLPHCGPRELQAELTQSKDALEQWLGRTVDSISMPGGRWNRRVLAACAQAGYRRVYTSEAWHRGGGYQGVERIGRFMVQRTTEPERIVQAVSGAGGFAARERGCWILKRAVRSLVGDGFYQSVWRRVRFQSKPPAMAVGKR